MNQALRAYDTLFIGNYTKDTIVTPTGTRYVDGGAMNYAGHAAARLGKRVAVATRLAREDAHVIRKLEEGQVDCFVTYTPSSTLMKLEYPTTNPDIRTLTVTGTAGSITADEVKDIPAHAVVIGSSLRGEVGMDVIRALRQPGRMLAGDLQGFVRVLRQQSLVYEPWEEMADTLALLDVVKSDAVEAEFLTGQADIFKAAKIFAQMGPREIVLTHKDGVLIYADGASYELGFYPGRMEGRSGRGDTCVGTYVTMRQTLEPREAGIWAAAVTSLKMETLGPFNRSIAEVEALIRARYRNGA